MAHAAPLWQTAASFAARAHGSAIRKDGRTPYFAHPVRVALTVATTFGCLDEPVLAAALLHDVIEDTGADYDDVEALCGRETAALVACLTKDMRMIEPERERAYDAQLAAGPWRARLIKLADVHDNLCDAEDEASKRTLLGKAERAVRLAEADDELAEARRIVQEVIDRVRAQVG